LLFYTSLPSRASICASGTYIQNFKTKQAFAK
jgi:hypothetical protein